MWTPLAQELKVPWRTAEAIDWQLGKEDICRRGGFDMVLSETHNTDQAQRAAISPHQVKSHQPTRASARDASPTRLQTTVRVQLPNVDMMLAGARPYALEPEDTPQSPPLHKYRAIYPTEW